MKLSRNGWRTILSLPLACDELGQECPEWAWWLCEHATAVADGSPAVLLEALEQSAKAEGGAPIPADLAELGVSLDLCEVLEPVEKKQARIRPTTFGHAIVMLLGGARNEDTLEGHHDS